MVGVRVSLKLETSWEFNFAKDRMAPKANRFLEYYKMQFHREKKLANKKAARACLKV